MKFSVANLELWYEMHSNEALVSLLDSLTLDMAKWNFLKGRSSGRALTFVKFPSLGMVSASTGVLGSMLAAPGSRFGRTLP